MATATAAEGTALDRIAKWVEADPILAAMRRRSFKLGLASIEPSGVDLIAAAIARRVCVDGRPEAIALAVPRGRTRLPLFLAAYFGIGRVIGLLPLHGSVALSTRDQELRTILDNIRVAGSDGQRLDCGRLVTGRPDPTGRASAKLGELLGSARIRGLSQDDKFILLQAPNYRPELALNVIGLSVVDATSMSDAGWPLTFEWNRAAQRSQVWVGELGDRRFDEFCTTCGIPLWRFNWPTIEEATKRYSVGQTRLATRELCDRALAPAPIQARPCPDDVVDEELAKLDEAFAAVYRCTKGEDVPSIVARASRLRYLLGRLAAPLVVYEPIAAGTRALQPNVVLRQVREAPPVFFQGAKWKGVLESEWPAIRAGLSALYEHIHAEYPKYWDVLMRIERARADGEQLVFRCATRTEAHALAAALVAEGFVAADEYGDDRLIDVRWYGTSSPALQCGGANKRLTTVIFEPPPPYAAAQYLSAETGRTEALLYPTQLPRFERLARATWTACSNGANADMVEMIAGVHVEHDESVAPPAAAQLEPFTLSGRGTVKKRTETREIISMDGFFARLAALDDEDVPTWGGGPRETGPTLLPRPARLVRSAEGFCVFLPEGEEVPVLVGGESRTLQCGVAELRPGQRIVLMPGSDRASMLAELFDSFDQRLGPAYPLLYARAFVEAYKNAGGTDRALAERVGVDEATVATWRRGEHRPQQDHVLFAVLELSGLEPAWTNRTKIREYLATVRGHHRQIAKIFDEAVVETVVELGDQARSRLEPLGLDLDAFFNSVQVIKVASVSGTSHDVPGAVVGQFLTPDHPLVKVVA